MKYREGMKEKNVNIPEAGVILDEVPIILPPPDTYIDQDDTFRLFGDGDEDTGTAHRKNMDKKGEVV